MSLENERGCDDIMQQFMSGLDVEYDKGKEYKASIGNHNSVPYSLSGTTDIDEYGSQFDANHYSN